MDIMYKDTISAQINGKEWKIIMILEIVDCLNGLCENHFTYNENMYLLSDICMTWHINIKHFILFYLVNHFIINVYFYCTISLKIFWVRINENNNICLLFILCIIYTPCMNIHIL